MKDVIEYDLIITIVNRGFSDYVIEASRDAGATGGTILYARGTNINEINDSFMGVLIRPEKDVILTLVERKDKNKVMKSISESVNLSQNGKGICFSLCVSDVRGISKPNKVKPKTTKPKTANSKNTTPKASEPETIAPKITTTKITKPKTTVPKTKKEK